MVGISQTRLANTLMIALLVHVGSGGSVHHYLDRLALAYVSVAHYLDFLLVGGGKCRTLRNNVEIAGYVVFEVKSRIWGGLNHGIIFNLETLN